MKIWLDDTRRAPFGYLHCHSVNDAIQLIENFLLMFKVSGGKDFYKIELIDCDHDLGDWAADGGDGIKLLDWLEEKGYNFPIRLHTMNPVGRENMRAVIRKNNWEEVF